MGLGVWLRYSTPGRAQMGLYAARIVIFFIFFLACLCEEGASEQ